MALGCQWTRQQHIKFFARSMMLMISSSTSENPAEEPMLLHVASTLHALVFLPWFTAPWRANICWHMVRVPYSVLLAVPNTAFAHLPELHFFANQGPSTGAFIALMSPVASCDVRFKAPATIACLSYTHCAPCCSRGQLLCA